MQPNISSFSTLTLLADSDATHDARVVAAAAKARWLVNRIRLVIAEGPVDEQRQATTRLLMQTIPMD
jgi:hypothetical protein